MLSANWSIIFCTNTRQDWYWSSYFYKSLETNSLHLASLADTSLRSWLPIPGSPDCIQDTPRYYLTHPVIPIYEQMGQMALLNMCCISLTIIGFPKGTFLWVNSALLPFFSSTAGFCLRLSTDYSRKQGEKKNSRSISTTKLSSGVVPNHTIHRIQNIFITLNIKNPATNERTLRLL